MRRGEPCPPCKADYYCGAECWNYTKVPDPANPGGPWKIVGWFDCYRDEENKKMPCYTPPPTKDELEAWARDAYRRGDYAGFMRNVTKEMLGQWLCDALGGRPPSEMAIKWLVLHRDNEKKR